MNYYGLDVTDNKILRILKEDARTSYSDIAKVLGISRVAIKNRIQALEERGVICGYKTVINSRLANNGIDFVLDLSVIPNNVDQMVNVLGRKPSITRVYIISGEGRIHAEGRVADLKELNEFTNHLYKDDTYGVKSLSFNVILSTRKDLDGGVEFVEERNDTNTEISSVHE